MKLNLDTVRNDIQVYLESRGLAVFYGFSRGHDHAAAVHWDTAAHPDYRDFLAAAETSGARLVTLFANEFTDDLIEDATQRLEGASLPADERRTFENRLRELRAYLGFTCQIELSFDVSPRIYIFDLHTEWFDDLNEILDRVDEAYEDEDDEAPLGGGYFSKN